MAQFHGTMHNVLSPEGSSWLLQSSYCVWSCCRPPLCIICGCMTLAPLMVPEKKKRSLTWMKLENLCSDNNDEAYWFTFMPEAINGDVINQTKILCCYIAEFFLPATHTLIGYFKVTWHLTIKLFRAKSLLAGNSALLPAKVDRWSSLLLLLHVFLSILYNKSLNDWSLRKQFIFFPSNLNVSLGCASGKHWVSTETKWTVSWGTSH